MFKCLYLRIKKKKEAIIEFKNCFFVIFKGCFKINAKKIIKIPATEKRIEAKKKGDNSVTATLLNKYVDPQTT